MEESRENGAVKWVSCEWLEQHLKDHSLILIDSQPDVHDYLVRHIAGAVYMNEKLLRIADGNLPTGYIPEQVMSVFMSRVGISSQKPVVVYTDTGAFSKAGDGLEQTMMAYSLARFGHRQVYILDGGLPEWIRQNRPVTKDIPTPEESSYESIVHEDLYMTYEQLRATKDNKDVVIIDVRPRELYEGQGMWKKPGHIPGAYNLPWTKLMSAHNSRMVSQNNHLNEIIEQMDLSRTRELVFYCGTGREATAAFCVFKWYLSFPRVRLFEGSFTQWCLDPDNPTVTGPNPR